MNILVDPTRFHRAHTQTFYILNTPSRFLTHPCLLILGSSGNEYSLTITNTSISCNCPDTNCGCKHILFILLITGFLKPCDRYVSIQPAFLIHIFHEQHPPRKIKASQIDSHTNELCSQYLGCHYCPRRTVGTIIICSKCGSLGHKSCFQLFFHNSNTCPRCIRPFVPIESSTSNGYRNFRNVLTHFHYETDSHQSFTRPTGRRTANTHSNNSTRTSVIRRRQRRCPPRPLMRPQTHLIILILCRHTW